MTLSLRTLALPVGRGMYTMASVSPVLTEPLTMPLVDLDGRLPPKHTVVDFDWSSVADE